MESHLKSEKGLVLKKGMFGRMEIPGQVRLEARYQKGDLGESVGSAKEEYLAMMEG